MPLFCEVILFQLQGCLRRPGELCDVASQSKTNIWHAWNFGLCRQFVGHCRQALRRRTALDKKQYGHCEAEDEGFHE
jgi:hypothetical protein